MTRTDALKCIHEPFGDAFYFGPERLSERYEKDEEARLASGFSQSTYKSVLDNITKQQEEEVRPPSIRPRTSPPFRVAHPAPALSALSSSLADLFF